MKCMQSRFAGVVSVAIVSGMLLMTVAASSSGPPTYIPSGPSGTTDGWGPIDPQDDAATDGQADHRIGDSQIDENQVDAATSQAVVDPQTDFSEQQQSPPADDRADSQPDPLPAAADDPASGESAPSVDLADEDDQAAPEPVARVPRISLRISETDMEEETVQLTAFLEDEAARGWRIIVSNAGEEETVAVTTAGSGEQSPAADGGTLNRSGIRVCETQPGEASATASIEAAPAAKAGGSPNTIRWSMVLAVD